MSIIELNDQSDLVSAADYPYAEFPFEKFNPVQSRVVDFYDRDINAIIASATSSGKTVVGEMFLSHTIRELRSKCMYLSPLKSLSQEKIDDWKSLQHHFKDLKISICTGDYRLTADRRKELEDADLIIMTTEMLSSRLRNFKAENNQWLQDVATIVIDEIHLIGTPGRGDKLEVAIMKMAALRPCRFIGLSATIPNVNQIAEWISRLNNKDAYVLKSKYRPCPLFLHYNPYNDKVWGYKNKENEKISEALDLVKEYPNDKFLIFTHSKATGRRMLQALKQSDIDSEFHNANLGKAKRLQIENDFRNSEHLRVIVATSGLAAGVNVPARRVIILGVHRGIESIDTEIPSYEIQQMTGRSGRPKYDKRGDAYVLLPQSKIEHHISRLQNPEDIESQLVVGDDFRSLAFHIVNEIHQRNIKDLEGIYNWYYKTLAAYQNKELDDSLVDSMVDMLLKRNIIYVKDGSLDVTPIGKISSIFYFSPFDVSDYKVNFDTLFEYGKEMDEKWLSVALGNIDTNRRMFATADEKEQMESFQLSGDIYRSFYKINEGTFKSSFCYYLLMNGQSNPVMDNTLNTYRLDIERIIEMITALDSMGGKWDQSEYFKKLSLRMRYGVDWNRLALCGLKGIGKVKAMKLWQANIRGPEDIIKRPKLMKLTLKCSDKVADRIVEEAKTLISA